MCCYNYEPVNIRLASNIQIGEVDTISNVYLSKLFTYASYIPTPDVIFLHFIDYYVQCHCYFAKHQLPCLDVTGMI